MKKRQLILMDAYGVFNDPLLTAKGEIHEATKACAHHPWEDEADRKAAEETIDNYWLLVDDPDSVAHIKGEIIKGFQQLQRTFGFEENLAKYPCEDVEPFAERLKKAGLYVVIVTSGHSETLAAYIKESLGEQLVAIEVEPNKSRDPEVFKRVNAKYSDKYDVLGFIEDETKGLLPAIQGGLDPWDAWFINRTGKKTEEEVLATGIGHHISTLAEFPVEELTA